MMADGKKPGAGNRPDVLPTDHVFANHPTRGPIAVRVTSAGKDGFRGICDKGEKHGIPWDGYLGHKARAEQRFDVVDTGADGSVIKDRRGATKFVAGELPLSDQGEQAGERAGKRRQEERDDPLLDGMPALAKALEEFSMVRIPDGPRLLLKAGVPIKNRPGLQLKDVTDKDGHQTHRWTSTEQPGADAAAGKAPMKHGDVVGFKHGEVEGKGKIVGSGVDGVTLEDGEGRPHKVRHEHLTGPAGEGAGEGGGSGGGEKPPGGGGGDDDGPTDPDKFSAADFYAKHNDASATPESVLKAFPADTADKIKAVEADIAKVGQTIDTHKKDGAWTPERLAVHKKILMKFLSPEAIAAATPKDGAKPTFTILGGRGGSGKSWFEGKVFEKEHAIVLDADEIKKQLPEYAGWNAAQLHEESGELFDDITRIAADKGLNIVHDATMKTGKKAVALVEKFKSLGYRVEAHYMHLPRQEAAKRAVGRFLGETKRYVPAGVVLSNTDNEANFDSVKQHVDAWSFRDNNVAKGQEPRLIAEKKGNEADGREQRRDGLPAAGGPGEHGSRPGSSSEGSRGGGGFPPGHHGHYGATRELAKADGSGGIELPEGARLLLPAAGGTLAKSLAHTPVSVSGHMRDGVYRAPFESTRSKRLTPAEHDMAARQVHAVHSRIAGTPEAADMPDIDKVERWRLAVHHGELHPDDRAGILGRLAANAPEPPPSAGGRMMKALRGAALAFLFRRQVTRTKAV